jgi:hypothetical protein
LSEGRACVFLELGGEEFSEPELREKFEVAKTPLWGKFEAAKAKLFAELFLRMEP